jgi:uncharacterized membrane protein YgcG
MRVGKKKKKPKPEHYQKDQPMSPVDFRELEKTKRVGKRRRYGSRSQKATPSYGMTSPGVSGGGMSAGGGG